MQVRLVVRPGVDGGRSIGSPAAAKETRHALEMSFVQLTTIVVDDYDPAIAFFVDALGFELVEDSPSLTNAGKPKRWVVVRPPGAQTGILLARADGDHQSAVVGKQVAGRVGFFLQVENFQTAYRRMTDANVRFVTSPRDRTLRSSRCLPRHRG